MTMTSTYGPVLRQHLPPGPALEAPDGSQLAALLDGIGTSYDQWATIADALLQEFDPRTTTDLLSDWETAYGLPGSNPSPPATIAARRQALYARQQAGQPPTPAFFIALCATLGYTATITAPYTWSSCNGECEMSCDPGLPGNAYVWQINATSQGAAQDASLNWLVSQYVPSSTYLIWHLV